MGRCARIRDFAAEKRRFIVGAAIALLVAFGCLTYVNLTQTPIAGTELGPAAEPSAWSFALEDGTPLRPGADGGLELPEGGAAITCTRPLEGFPDGAVIEVSGLGEGVSVSAGGLTLSGAGGVFTLGRAEEITITARLAADVASLGALPRLTLYASHAEYASRSAAGAAASALPAGVFFVTAAFLAGFFLFGLYHGRTGWDLLLLTLLAISSALQATTGYGIYALWALEAPVLAWGLRALPVLVIMWLLWIHSDGPARRWGWLIPAALCLFAAAAAAWRLIDSAGGAAWMQLFLGRLLPATLLISLAGGAWLALRGNAWYRRFFMWGAALSLCMAAGLSVSALRGGAWWQDTASDFSAAMETGSFYIWPVKGLEHMLMLVFFLLAMRDFVASVAQWESQLQALTMQNRYTVEHAGYLRRSLDETRAIRHELRHHVLALRALCLEGDLRRVCGYLDRLGEEFDELPVVYTHNPLVNALVNSCAERAREIGAEFEAVIMIPEQLDMEDSDLAVLLSNMLDNAIEGVSSVPEGQPRSIQLEMRILHRASLFVSCSNTFSGALNRDGHGGLLTRKKEDGHGYGLRAMRRAAEKYGSALLIKPEGNVFYVEARLFFPRERGRETEREAGL